MTSPAIHFRLNDKSHEGRPLPTLFVMACGKRVTAMDPASANSFREDVWKRRGSGFRACQACLNAMARRGVAI